jgi:hypothetical protein
VGKQKSKSSGAGLALLVVIGLIAWKDPSVFKNISHSATAIAATVPSVSGNYNCAELEQLWDSQGGNQSDATMAAAIAEAESGGDTTSTDHDSNGTTDYGLWQINSINGGSIASYNPALNARQAISISGNGSTWWPWYTYRYGAEVGRC